MLQDPHRLWDADEDADLSLRGHSARNSVQEIERRSRRPTNDLSRDEELAQLVVAAIASRQNGGASH